MWGKEKFVHLGKAIRLGRLFNKGSGRLLAMTLDHARRYGDTGIRNVVMGSLGTHAKEGGTRCKRRNEQ
jgi:hypothetical protein